MPQQFQVKKKKKAGFEESFSVSALYGISKIIHFLQETSHGCTGSQVSSGVSGLWTSYTIAQGTQPGLIRPRLASQQQPTDQPSEALPCGFLWGFSYGLNGLLLGHSWDSQSTERPSNPLQPTSTGSQNVLQPISLHISTSCCSSHWLPRWALPRAL